MYTKKKKKKIVKGTDGGCCVRLYLILHHSCTRMISVSPYCMPILCCLYSTRYSSRYHNAYSETYAKQYDFRCCFQVAVFCVGLRARNGTPEEGVTKPKHFGVMLRQRIAHHRLFVWLLMHVVFSCLLSNADYLSKGYLSKKPG